jgi:phage-related holin
MVKADLKVIMKTVLNNILDMMVFGMVAVDQSHQVLVKKVAILYSVVLAVLVDLVLLVAFLLMEVMAVESVT